MRLLTVISTLYLLTGCVMPKAQTASITNAVKQPVAQNKQSKPAARSHYGTLTQDKVPIMNLLNNKGGKNA